MGNCPSDNASAIDQSSFWGSDGINWNTHRVGWVVAGICAIATVIISSVSVLHHCRNYTNPRQQRQILRILYMPPVYAIISFLSYRYFRDYIYYSLIEVVYEAVTLSAFLLLLIEFVADSANVTNPADALARKEKRRLIMPLCCWRYRPTKVRISVISGIRQAKESDEPYFMYAVKWSVLQYVIVRPTISVISIICQAANVLCPSEGFSPHYADVYLQAIDFVSISVALYGLLLFYSLTKEELRGRRPLAKFLAIKLIVFFTFYQAFIFSALNGKVIHATEFWTSTNIANGLNALAICIEMIFFSAFMLWAYPSKEYSRKPGSPATRVWRPLWDSINYSDFAMEISGSIRYYTDRKSRAPSSQHNSNHPNAPPDFGTAFGVSGAKSQLPFRRSRTSIDGHEMYGLGVKDESKDGFDTEGPPPYASGEAVLHRLEEAHVHR